MSWLLCNSKEIPCFFHINGKIWFWIKFMMSLNSIALHWRWYLCVVCTAQSWLAGSFRDPLPLVICCARHTWFQWVFVPALGLPSNGWLQSQGRISLNGLLQDLWACCHLWCLLRSTDSFNEASMATAGDSPNVSNILSICCHRRQQCEEGRADQGGHFVLYGVITMYCWHRFVMCYCCSVVQSYRD